MRPYTFVHDFAFVLHYGQFYQTLEAQSCNTDIAPVNIYIPNLPSASENYHFIINPISKY